MFNVKCKTNNRLLFIMKKQFFYISFLCLLLALVSCKSHKKATNSVTEQAEVPSTQKNELSPAQKLEFDRIFFEGQKEKLLGNYENAAKYFESATKIDNQSGAAYYELGNAYMNMRKFAMAEQAAKIAIDKDNKNKWYRILLADVYQNQKKWSESAEVYEDLIELVPDNTDYYFNLAATYLMLEKPSDAIKVYDKVEKKFGPLENVILQKHKLYYELGKFDKAIEEINKLVKTDPGNTKYQQILAQTYLKAGKEAQAFELFKKLQETDSSNANLQLVLAEYYFKKGEKAKSFEMLKQAFANSNLDIDTKIQILYTNYLMQPNLDASARKDAYALTEILNKAHPKDAKAHAIYGDFLYQDKKNKEAKEEYKKAVSLKKDVFAVWQQLMLIEAELREYKDLEEDSENALELFPNQAIIYFFNGLAKMEQKKYKEAIEVMQSGLNLSLENQSLEGQFYVNLAEAYHRTNNYEKSDEYFEKALALDGNNILALNNYAYYLSIRNAKLKKAEEMSKKTITLEPENASYQDTYGWILFKMGKYEEAEKWIKKAVNQDRESGEVLEHYGDVLYKLGKTEEAVDYWKRAKKAGVENKDIDKKIAEQKILE